MAGDDNSTPPGSPAPKWKKPDGSSGSGEKEGDVVIQRVVREVGVGPTNWPLLTKQNYTEWALIMKIKMQARNLWDAIEPGGVSLQEDRMALDAITSAVPQEMVATLGMKDTTTEAWEAVKSMRIGSESVRKTKAQRLRREFESIRFNNGESVDDFTIRLGNLVAALSTVGETIPESKVFEKLLRVAPKRLSHVAVAIEVTADLSKLTLEDVGGRLRAAEDRDAEDDAPPPARSDGQLLLTKEQWMEKMRQSGDTGQTSSKGGRGGEQHRRLRKRGNGGGGRKEMAHGAPPRDEPCRNCGRTGHWAKECRAPKKGQAHLAQAEEDEPALLMALARAAPSPTGSSAVAPPSSPSASIADTLAHPPRRAQGAGIPRRERRQR